MKVLTIEETRHYEFRRALNDILRDVAVEDIYDIQTHVTPSGPNNYDQVHTAIIFIK